jgi:hypothetical protein
MQTVCQARGANVTGSISTHAHTCVDEPCLCVLLLHLVSEQGSIANGVPATAATNHQVTGHCPLHCWFMAPGIIVTETGHTLFSGHFSEQQRRRQCTCKRTRAGRLPRSKLRMLHLGCSPPAQYLQATATVGPISQWLSPISLTDANRAVSMYKYYYCMYVCAGAGS